VYLNDIFTVAANLTGMPAMSVPCGMTNTGLPIGLQLQANHFDEARLLQVAHRFQQATDWHLRAPPPRSATEVASSREAVRAPQP
jgi:aspartyl-tRNA(Asn)/glutamyl-tRNA(Gln) amidotransferase subunit A